MRKTFIVFVAALLLLIADPALAGNRDCNNQALVSGGLCDTTTNWLLFYDAPLAALQDLKDAIIAQYGYETEVVCAPNRQYEPLLNDAPSGVLVAAGVGQGDCSVVGQPTANPQSDTNFADAYIELELRNRIIAYQHNQAQAAADDVTQVPTPDVGASP
jgi:hypothetical protein